MTTSSEVTIVGNLTRDPELRYLTSGTAVCSFGVAVNRRYQKNGEWEEQTSFFDVTAWRHLADNVTESLVKGDRVIVTGRLEQRTWETDEGDKRSKVEITADNIGASLQFATAAPRKATPASATSAPHPADTAGEAFGEEPF